MNLPITLVLALGLQDPVLVDPPLRPERTSLAPRQDGTKQVLLDVDDLLDVKDDEGTPELDRLQQDAQQRAVILGQVHNDVHRAELVAHASNAMNLAKLQHRKLDATTALADILKRWMTPAFAPETDRMDVIAPGRIALTTSADKIAWAQRFCEVQRSAKDLVEVQGRLFYLPKGTLRSLGIEGATRTFDREADLDAFLAQVKDRDATYIANNPRLVTQPRAQASLSVGETVSYISDWRLEIVEPGPQTIAVPTIGSVFDGMKMECRAVPLKEGLYGLELNFTSSRLTRPIATKNLRIGSGEVKDVTVGLPEVKKVGIDTRVSLADGASLLFGGISPDEGREVAMTVTLRRAKIDSQPR